MTIHNYNSQTNSKTNLYPPPHGAVLRQSNSTHRLHGNGSIQKYPDLRRIQVGGGAVLANNSGLSPQVSAKANLSPRVPPSHSRSNLGEPSGNASSGSLAKPLYTRGQSKIGSGAVRPFQPSGNPSHQVSNTQIQ